ncbi:MAG: penicillin-binding protein 2 [Nocardioidaceae bacterium]
MSQRTPRDPGERSAKRPVGATRRTRRPQPAAARSPAPRPSRPRPRRTIRLATGPFRLWSAFCVVAFVLSLFAARLIQLQGIDENDYAALAVAKGAQTITLEARRAPIYDRFGVKLAESVDAAKLVADPTFTSAHATEIAVLLHRRIGADYLETVALLRTKDTRYVELARHLSPRTAGDTVARLDQLKLPGIYSAHDTLRVYPGGDVAASLLGYVGTDGLGLQGIESSYEDILKGHDGEATYQVEAGQILPLADSTVVQPREGTGVRLTIDQDLQFLAQRRLAAAVEGASADSGVAVVMDTRTSQVLALADYPTFNSNTFHATETDFGISAGLGTAYEPGSVEKVLTFSALIDGGYVTPRTKIVVPSYLSAGSDIVHDYFGHDTLHLTAAGVVAKSSNIGTVRAAAQMPNAELYRYLQRFGIGSRPEVGIGGLSAGQLAPPSTWPEIQRANIDFGQGMSVSALQMAAAVSAVANGGEYIAPSLVQGTVDDSGHVTAAPAAERHRVISPEAAHDVARMMETVIGPEGTAPVAAIPGYRVAGKTGTAQRANPDCGCYDGTFTVSFAGFAPADDPRFVVYVVIQNPRQAEAGGGATAGPVFHDLMVSALQKYGVPPTGTHEPLLPATW